MTKIKKDDLTITMVSSNLQRPIGFKPWEVSALFNKDVITQHAEDAAFLWTQRDQAVKAPNYLLKDLSDLDERVEAHLDGLRIADHVGWQICEEALESEEPGEIFTAGVLAFESGDTERIQKVLDTGISSPELERALISALGWIEFDKVGHIIRNFLDSDNPEIRRVGIAAFTVHRRDPGTVLSQTITDSDLRLRTRALKAAGELGRTDLLPLIVKSCSSPDIDCRFYAAWSSARLGNRTDSVLDVLKKFTEESGPYSERAMDIAIRCMNVPQAKDWLQKMKNNTELLRLSTIGEGALGDPKLIGNIISLMQKEDIARAAGEAFSMITGLDLAYEDLEQDQPEGFESGPSEEPEDEEVSLDKDEDLPWPAPDLIGKWWNDNKKNFRAGRRYLNGNEINKSSLYETLKHGNQRQRAAAALELGLLEPNKPLFEVRAPGKRQIKKMA